MKRVHVVVLGAVLWLCGCAARREFQYVPGTGDAAAFILEQAIIRGGRPASTNSWPAITGPWRYFEDQYGIIIRLPRSDYPAVEALLRQAFGPPRFGPTDTVNGGKLGGYRLTPKGGGIQFGYDKDGTHLTILRPLSRQEATEGFRRSVEEME